MAKQLLILKSGWERNYKPGDYPYNLKVLQRMQNNLYHFDVDGGRVEFSQDDYEFINGKKSWINDDNSGGSMPNSAVDRIIEVD